LFKNIRKMISNEKDMLTYGVATLEFFKEQNSALKIAKFLQSQYPQFHGGFALEGSVHFAKDNILKAIECYEKVTRIEPDIEDGWFIHSNLLSNDQRYEKALDVLILYFSHLKKVGKEPSSMAWNNLGWYLYLNGYNKDSLRCFKKAIELNKDNYTAWSNLDLFYSDYLDLKNAIAIYDATIKNAKYADLLAFSNYLKNYINYIETALDKTDFYYRLGYVLDLSSEKANNEERNNLREQSILSYEKFINNSVDNNLIDKAKSHVHKLKKKIIN